MPPPFIGASGSFFGSGFQNTYMSYQIALFYPPPFFPYYGQFLFPFLHGPTNLGGSSMPMSNPYARISFGNPFMHPSNPYVNPTQIIFINTYLSSSPTTSMINTQQQLVTSSSALAQGVSF